MNSTEMLGGPFYMSLFACVALYFVARGLAIAPRSRQLANLALFCGLTLFFMPEFILGPTTADRSALLLASGVIRLLIGLIGLLLALMAFVNRRDGGVGLARPMIAAGVSLAHLAASAPRATGFAAPGPT